MKNKAKAIEVIKGDCKIKQKYMDAEGNTCAIGALALSVGVKFPEQDPENYPSAGFQGNKESIDGKFGGVSDFVFKIQEALLINFGLTPLILGQIQTANDSHNTPEDRQAAILTILDSIPEDPIP